ncbi:hypothetical protein DERP_010883 [Dermatophagoides pteronyssinus]|uniref:Uncharacterized protein n=1 Tax=Dermatophagoides pteronyssinus TaxID=6956 RepID=A0ABQ8JV20_DERPT|nr:hypothetical protein DERP_010883 [Dermatophagoides pteronyssinus]
MNEEWRRAKVCLLKPRLQMEHLNGHEPLCTYIWLLRSPGVGTVIIVVEEIFPGKRNEEKV